MKDILLGVLTLLCCLLIYPLTQGYSIDLSSDNDIEYEEDYRDRIISYYEEYYEATEGILEQDNMYDAFDFERIEDAVNSIDSIRNSRR